MQEDFRESFMKVASWNGTPSLVGSGVDRDDIVGLHRRCREGGCDTVRVFFSGRLGAAQWIR
jgi:hypothetical protein